MIRPVAPARQRRPDQPRRRNATCIRREGPTCPPTTRTMRMHTDMLPANGRDRTPGLVWRRLVCYGVALEALFALVFLAGGYLDWYPSRLGAPAAWIEDHVLALARPLFVGTDGKLAVAA